MADKRDRKNEPEKVGDRVSIVDSGLCDDEAKIGETGKIIEFKYAINDWWNGENSIDYRVLVELDRKRVENIYVSLFLSDLRKIHSQEG